MYLGASLMAEAPAAYFRDFRNPFPRYPCTKAPCFTERFSLRALASSRARQIFTALSLRRKGKEWREREREREKEGEGEKATFAISYFRFPNSPILIKNRSNILFARHNVHEELVSTCSKEMPRVDISMQIKQQVKRRPCSYIAAAYLIANVSRGTGRRFNMNHLVTSMTSRFTMAIEVARSTLR
jgi:hypothetical protein